MKYLRGTPREHLLAYLLYDYCNDLKDGRDELRYFGALHIARIMWEKQEARFKKNIEKSIKGLENKKINLKRQYKKALRLLRVTMSKEKNKIDNLGHYLSRIEVDDLLFKKLKRA